MLTAKKLIDKAIRASSREEMSLTRDQLDWQEVGEDFAKDWLSRGNDPRKFDGQSEAYDLATSLAPGQSTEAADWMYKGMMSVISKARSGRRWYR